MSPAQTGLMRLTWDNGDRTVLVRSDLGGVTLGWDLSHRPPTKCMRLSRAWHCIRGSSWREWPAGGVASSA